MRLPFVQVWCDMTDRNTRTLKRKLLKRSIKALMWARAMMGGIAIHVAPAIVVFLAIAATDTRADNFGLTTIYLLAVLLVAWASSWGAGRLANNLSLRIFGRPHPKFDT